MTITTFTSPHLVGGHFPPTLVAYLAKEGYAGAFPSTYTTFIADHGAAPHFACLPPRLKVWLNRYRNNSRYRTPARTLALLYLRTYQEDEHRRARYNGHHDLARYGQLYGHTCVGFKEEGNLPTRLGTAHLGLFVFNLRQAHGGKGSWYLLPTDEALLERGQKSWRWYMPPGGNAANALREELAKVPPTEENRWLWEWAKAYYFRATQGPLFLNTWQNLPADVQRFVAPYIGPERAKNLAKLEEYQKVALAQLMLAPPEELFPELLPAEWLPENCIGQATRLMGNLTNLRLE